MSNKDFQLIPPDGTKLPESLYSCCDANGCTAEVSNPAERMYWCRDGWRCEDCIEYGDDLVVGIRLDRWLACVMGKEIERLKSAMQEIIRTVDGTERTRGQIASTCWRIAKEALDE